MSRQDDMEGSFHDQPEDMAGEENEE